MQRRRSEQQRGETETERAELIEQIVRLKETLEKMNRRVNEQQQRQQKMLESNMRNEKRLLRYRARVEEMARYKDSPEHFLAMGGFMNESIQEYIFSHNYTLTTDPTQVDPDNMTYEQLLDLGDKIGKVSKGLSKEDVQRLPRRPNKRAEECCPICQHQLELGELIIELRCLHTYHEECILFWLKDENTCPICKDCLSERGKEERVDLL